MKTKKEIKAWLNKQKQFSNFGYDQISFMVDDIQVALKKNPNRTKFEFDIAYIQIPSYRGLKPE